MTIEKASMGMHRVRREAWVSERKEKQKRQFKKGGRCEGSEACCCSAMAS